MLRLGLVSLLTDLSSEMIFSVFAVFFTSVAGASAALLGVVEGLADLSASSLNYLAGWLSDRSGRRKPLALAGYAFSTLAKLILLASSSITGLALFRVIERLGKSFRGPPRDAWLSGVAEQAQRGWAFGVHKALDKAGAVLGPLLAYGLLSLLGEESSTYRTLFYLAIVPAILSVWVLLKVGDRHGAPHRRESMRHNWQALSPGFKRFLLVSGLFALGYFSFGFLLLKAYQVGFAVRHIVLLYALFNLAAVLTAPLLGMLGDRLGRAGLLMAGYVGYAVICLGFAFATERWQIVLLFILYGVFYATDEAQSKAFVSDLEPERRASAIGMSMFVNGLMYLPASLLAGALWMWHPAAAFVLAALLASAAAAAFAWLRPDRLAAPFTARRHG